MQKAGRKLIASAVAIILAASASAPAGPYQAGPHIVPKSGLFVWPETDKNGISGAWPQQHLLAEPYRHGDVVAPILVQQLDLLELSDLQTKLNALGYDVGDPNGRMTGRTQQAISQFQRETGLLVTGIADPITLSAIDAAVSGRSDPGRGEAVSDRAAAPSFDCALASVPSEIAICSDPALAALDIELNDAYGVALAMATPDRQVRLRQLQRDWLSLRNGCGANPVCLAILMEERIAALASMRGTAEGGVQPGVPARGEIVEIQLEAPISANTRALDPSRFPDLIFSQGLPVISFDSSALSRGLGRDYFGIQIAFLRSLSHGDAMAAGDLEVMPIDPLRVLSGAEIRDLVAEALGGTSDRMASGLSMLERETDPARRSGALSAILMRAPGFTEFDRQRLENALAERARDKAGEDAVTGPVDVLLVCAFIGAYDFASETFALRTQDIDRSCLNATLPQQEFGAETQLRIDAGRTPASLPMPVADAEVLRDRVADDAMFIAFPARISARLEGGARPRLVFEGNRTGPYRAVRGSDPTETLHVLEDTDLPMTDAERMETALSDLSRPWRLWSAAERDRIVAEARRVAPGDLARAVSSPSSDPLSFTFRVDVPFRDDASELSGLMRAGGQQTFGDNRARAIAELLGRPTTSVGIIPMRSVNPDHPLRNVVVLLPSGAETYDLPADLPPLAGRGSNELRALDFSVSDGVVTTVSPETGLPFAGELLVLRAIPTRLVGVQGGRALQPGEAETELWSAAFAVTPTETSQTFGATNRISLARPADLVYAAAAAADLPAEEVIGYALSPGFLRDDTFGRQDAAAALAAEAEARAQTGGRLVVTAFMRLGAYDTARNGWEWSWRGGIRYPSDLSPEEAGIYLPLPYPLDPAGEPMRHVPMPVDDARALSGSAAHPEYLARIHIEMDPVEVQRGNVVNTVTGVAFPFRIHQIELLEPSANPALDNPDARIARIVLQIPEAAPEPEPVPGAVAALPPPPQTDLRILGLALGDPVSDAEAMLRERMPSGRVYTRSREAQAAMGQLPQGLPDWAPFYEANVFVSADGSEMVSLYREPGADNVVSAITRSRFFDPGQGPLLAEVSNQLLATFGEPADRPLSGNGEPLDEGVFAWNEGASTRVEQDGVMVTDASQAACLRSMSASVGLMEMHFVTEQATRANSWTPPDWTVWVDETAERWLPPIANPVDLSRMFGNGGPECRGTHLFVWVEGGTDGRLWKLRFALVDPGYAARLADRTREAIQNSGPAGSAGGSQLDL